MNARTNRRMFEHYASSQRAAQLSTTDDALICPLCWQQTHFDGLSIDHVVPGAVGGKAVVLTCTRCNNEQGSSLDSHLVRFQELSDVFRGFGTLRTMLDVNGQRIAADLACGTETKNFRVVGRATDPKALQHVVRVMKAGEVSGFNVSYTNYSKNRFHTAILRAAYLALFKCYGYEYAAAEIVQAIRRRIQDPTMAHPDLKSLIIGLESNDLPIDEPHFVVPGKVNDVEFFLVVVTVKRETVSHLGAFMPVPVNGCERFFELMDIVRREREGKPFKISFDTSNCFQ